MDYFFMSREDEEASKNPLLVIADERSGSRYARAVGIKGLGEAGQMDWLIEDISINLKSWGHAGGTGGEVIVKSDGEPALLAVRNALMRYHGGVMIPECPAKGEKAENGLIEEAGKTVRDLVCTFISQIEYGIDDKLPLDACIVPWIVRWAAICYSRYVVGKDGRTAYERLRGRSCKAVVVVPMGEKVWYKQLGDGGDRRHKAETQWFSGVWLGPATSSSETLIGTTKGVVKASAIKRFASRAEQWDVNALLDMQGAPQRPDPTKPGLSIPVRIRMEPEVSVEMPMLRPAREEVGPRKAYILTRHFEQHGYSEGCEGCGRLSAGMKGRPHSDACRKRMYGELRKTERGRAWLKEAEERIDGYLEERVREDHEARDEAERKEKEEETANAAKSEAAETAATDAAEAKIVAGPESDDGAPTAGSRLKTEGEGEEREKAAKKEKKTTTRRQARRCV